MARPKQSSVRKALTQTLVQVSQAMSTEMLAVGEVITADTSTAPREVGFGNIVRVEVGGADTYVTFGDDSLGAVTASTSPAIKLEAGLFYNILATDDFIRSSAAFLRVEVISIRS